MTVIELSLCISVIAYVYSTILTDEGMILGKLYTYLEYHLPEWVFNPIIGCAKCVSGQIALWYYPLNFGLKDYDIRIHLFLICLTILTTSFIKELHTWIKRKALN